MIRRSRFLLALAFVLVAAASWMSAQAVMPQPFTPPITVSGDDIQFRVESRMGSRVIGRLLVRVDGQWVEADTTGGATLRRLQSQ